MSEIFQMAWVHIRKMRATPRVWLVFVFLVIFTRNVTRGFGAYCIDYNMTIAPWIYPFIFANNYQILIFFMNFILLLADAPFMDETQLFYVLRLGKKTWYLGQFLYIVMVSIGYFFSIFLWTAIWLAPYMSWQSGWGKILKTLAIKGSYGYDTGVDITRTIIEKYSPLTAVIFSFALCVLTGILLGMVMFILNLFVKRGSGLAVACILVMLQFFIYFVDAGKMLRYLSPVSWVNLEYIRDTSLGFSSWFPPVGFMGLIMILVAIGLKKIRLVTFEVQEEI